MKCEKCLEEKPLQFFDVFHPEKQKTIRHYICHKCINTIISNWFDVTKTGSW